MIPGAPSHLRANPVTSVLFAPLTQYLKRREVTRPRSHNHYVAKLGSNPGTSFRVSRAWTQAAVLLGKAPQMICK